MKKFTYHLLALALFFSVSIAKSQYVWKQMLSMPGNDRCAETEFTIGNYAFVGTGWNGSYLNDFKKWSQSTNTWSSIANYPGAGTISCCGFSINGTGYVGLGIGSSGAASDLWAYDTATNNWVQKASLPGTARGAAFVFVIGGKAYIGGGTAGGPPYLNDFWVYDPSANSWTQLGNYPGGKKSGQFAFTIGNNGYAGCGNSDGSDFYNDFWKYYPSTDSWVGIDSLPVSTKGIVAGNVSFVLGGKGYVGTGTDNPSSPTWLRDFWAYDTVTGKWNSIISLTGVGRQRSCAFSVGNTGYVCGGVDSANIYLNDLWEYTDTALTALNNISASTNDFIKIYPNPTKGSFTLLYQGLTTEKSDFIMYDLMGNQLNKCELSGKKGSMNIDENNLSSGIYLYRIVSENMIIASGKIVITN